MGKDYGYFGSGASGYGHYMQSFNRNSSGSGGGGGDGGCLIWMLLICGVLWLLTPEGMIFLVLAVILIIISNISSLFKASGKNEDKEKQPPADYSDSKADKPQPRDKETVKQLQKNTADAQYSIPADRLPRSGNLTGIILPVICSVAFLIYINHTVTRQNQREYNRKISEIQHFIDSGKYTQAFDAVEDYIPDGEESARWNKKIKDSMPEKARVEMFPEEYIKFTLTVYMEERVVNGKREKYFTVKDLKYVNKSSYDVKISHPDCEYFNGKSVIYESLRYSETFEKNTCAGYNTYNNSYASPSAESYVIIDGRKYTVTDFDVKVIG